MGKITIVKSLALSQLTLLLTVLPNPPQEFISKVNKLIHKFIWNGKPDRVSRKVIINDYKHGGLNMLDLCSFQKGLKCSWVHRLLDSSKHAKWKVLVNGALKHTGIQNIIWKLNTRPSDFPFHLLKNNFLQDVVEAWLDLRQNYPCSHFMSQIIWFNSEIKINNKCVFYQSWLEAGILTIKDLCSDDGNFLTFQSFKLRFSNIKCTFIRYCGLLKALPRAWKRDITKEFEITPGLIEVFSKQKKPSKFVCNLLT